MFSIIITIISIALVALLALATIYYGGSSFNRSSAEANATKVLTQAQQILSADQLYRADHPGKKPTSMQELVDAGYLKSIPTASLSTKFTAFAAAEPISWTMINTANGRGYSLSNSSLIDEDSCKGINFKSLGQNGILKEVYSGYITQCYGPSTSNLTVLIVTDPLTPTTDSAVLPNNPVVVGGASISSSSWLITPTTTSAGGSGSGGASAPADGSGGASAPSGGASSPSTVTAYLTSLGMSGTLPISADALIDPYSPTEGVEVVNPDQGPLVVTGVTTSVPGFTFTVYDPGCSVVSTSPATHQCVPQVQITQYPSGLAPWQTLTIPITIQTNYGSVTGSQFNAFRQFGGLYFGSTSYPGATLVQDSQLTPPADSPWLKQTILNIGPGSPSAYAGPNLDMFACCASDIWGATPAEKPQAAKQYSEVEFIKSTANTAVLIMNSRYSDSGTYYGGPFTDSISYQSDGTLQYWENGGLQTVSSQAFSTGDVIGVAADHLAQKVWISKNGAWLNGDPSTGSGGYSMTYTGGIAQWSWLPRIANSSNTSGLTVRFISHPAVFKYSPPSGYVAPGYIP